MVEPKEVFKIYGKIISSLEKSGEEFTQHFPTANSFLHKVVDVSNTSIAPKSIYALYEHIKKTLSKKQESFEQAYPIATYFFHQTSPVLEKSKNIEEEEEEGTISTDDERTAEKLAKKGHDVDLKSEQQEEDELSEAQIKTIGEELSIPLSQALESLSTEVLSIDIVDIVSNRFKANINYSESRESRLSFKIEGNTLYLEVKQIYKPVGEIEILPSGKVKMNQIQIKDNLIDLLKQTYLEEAQISEVELIRSFLENQKDSKKKKKLAGWLAKAISDFDNQKKDSSSLKNYDDLEKGIKETKKKIDISESLRTLIEEAYFEALKESAILSTSSQQILAKFPTVKKTLARLLTSEYEEFVDEVKWTAPRPSTFEVSLKNGHSFYLKWLGDSFQAEIQSKRYNIGTLAGYQQALAKINDVLKTTAIEPEQPEDLEGGEFGDEPTGDFGGGGGGAGADSFGADLGGEEGEEEEGEEEVDFDALT